MTKKQIDLFGNKIIEKSLPNKLEEGASKVLEYLKSNIDVLSLVKPRGRRTLLKYSSTLNSRNLKKVKEIVKLLEKIYNGEESDDYKYFAKISADEAKFIYLNIVWGLRWLYNDIKKKTNDLEQFRAFFEMQLFFIETVFKRIKYWIEDLFDVFGRTEFTPKKLCKAARKYLRATSIDYEAPPNVKVSLSFIVLRTLIRALYRINKFYDINNF